MKDSEEDPKCAAHVGIECKYSTLVFSCEKHTFFRVNKACRLVEQTKETFVFVCEHLPVSQIFQVLDKVFIVKVHMLRQNCHIESSERLVRIWKRSRKVKDPRVIATPTTYNADTQEKPKTGQAPTRPEIAPLR